MVEPISTTPGRWPCDTCLLVTPALVTAALVTPALVTPALVTPALVTPALVRPLLGPLIASLETNSAPVRGCESIGASL
jgi:hypothetical protein